MKLLIARHGNTFDEGDVLLRVGRRTDLPLSLSGQEQAVVLGAYLKRAHRDISRVYTSNLMRTKQTAQIALDEMQSNVKTQVLDIFDEIDYGSDEGRPEDKVVQRVGEDALKLWDSEAVVPKGWLVDVKKIKSDWIEFADSIKDSGETVLVVTSNGIARFAPYILDNPKEFMANNKIKLSTGAVSCLSFEDGKWKVEYWNKRG